MSPVARQRHGFEVARLQEHGADDDVRWQEALFDNSRTPVPDAAGFRIDFPRWLGQLGERNRRIAEIMAIGERTSKLADTFSLTRGRVSQLRRQFYHDWQRFHGEPVDNTEPAVA